MSRAEKHSSARRALVVGIDAYQMFPLRLCVDDAMAVGEVLRESEYSFDVKILLDESATRRNILSAFDWLRSTEVSLALLYLAGHGEATSYGTYFNTVDTQPFDEGIDVRSIPQLMGVENAEAQQHLMIYDFCHSGAGTPRGTAPNTLSTSRLRGDIAETPMGRGSAVLAACQDQQSAREYAALGHGKFTYHLLHGLYGEAAVRGDVTAHSLYDYVSRGFSDDEEQRPVWRGDFEGSLILGSGVVPIEESKPQIGGVDPQDVRRMVRESEDHLNEYHSRLNTSRRTWKETGWLAAASELEELLHWFDKKLAAYPELAREHNFVGSYESAKSILSQLASVQAGIQTVEGALILRIGSGAFGSVWLVKNTAGTERAYKVYHPGDLNLDDKLTRFERGWRAMRRLNHDHIVSVSQFTRAPIGFFMQYIDGPNLRKMSPCDVLETSGQLDLLVTIAEAVAHAHAGGVIHRDIKPENIVSRFDESQGSWFPYLTDFDLAWFSTATQVTKEGFGAQFYSAPEQFLRPNSNESHGPTVDIYAFGQLCFFVCTGRDPEPLGSEHNLSVLQKKLEGWSSATAAQGMLEFYAACTKYDWKNRLPNFSEVTARLGDVRLKARALNDHMSLDQMVGELLHAFGSVDPDVVGMVARSRSGRTRISLSRVRERSAVSAISFDLEAVRLERILAPGAGNYAEGRQTIAKRLDQALANFPQEHMRRRSSSTNVHTVKITFDSVPMRLEGLTMVQAAVSQLIAAFETA